MDLVWKFIVSFLMGAVPFAKVAMIGTGIDITKVGSKNPGFNNVLRVASKWRAAIALKQAEATATAAQDAGSRRPKRSSPKPNPPNKPKSRRKTPA